MVELGGVVQTIKVAHFRLCYSHQMFMVAYPRETQEMVLCAWQSLRFLWRSPQTHGAGLCSWEHSPAPASMACHRKTQRREHDCLTNPAGLAPGRLRKGVIGSA